ncbi:MAG: hypothetical protein IPJ76_13135 [Flavobacteriales bacterium]|nr:MAG: hypothetical protein IPJ76_13135 [Flavobacteriales bacterium]
MGSKKKKNPILTEPVRKGPKGLKVRLDARTIITVSNMKIFEAWKKKYPKAEIIG